MYHMRRPKYLAPGPQELMPFYFRNDVHFDKNLKVKEDAVIQFMENDTENASIHYDEANNKLLFNISGTTVSSVSSSGFNHENGLLQLTDDTVCQINLGDSADADVCNLSYTHATNALSLVCNTQEVMNIASEVVAITGSSDSTLNLLSAGTTNDSIIQFSDSGADGVADITYNHNNNRLDFNTGSGSLGLRIDASQDLFIPNQILIGQTSGAITGDLHIKKSGSNTATLTLSSASGNTQLNLGPTSAPANNSLRIDNSSDIISFYTNNVGRMSITTSLIALTTALSSTQSITTTSTISASNFSSGVYSPTLTNTANSDTLSVGSPFIYQHIDDVLIISGRILFNRINTSSESRIRFSLPSGFSKTFSASTEAVGQGEVDASTSSEISSAVGYINTSNNVPEFQFRFSGTTNETSISAYLEIKIDMS